MELQRVKQDWVAFTFTFIHLFSKRLYTILSARTILGAGNPLGESQISFSRSPGSSKQVNVDTKWCDFLVDLYVSAIETHCLGT